MRARGSQKSANIPTTPSAVPDVLGPDLEVVFCGINPGRVSAEAGAHFANPRNDFWRLLHDAGFTPRLYDPTEQFEPPRARDRCHERRLSHDKGLERPSPQRFHGLSRATRAIGAGASTASDRVRREGGLSRHVSRAPRAGPADARDRRRRALRPALDVTGERRRPVRRAPAVVHGAEEPGSSPSSESPRGPWSWTRRGERCSSSSATTTARCGGRPPAAASTRAKTSSPRSGGSSPRSSGSTTSARPRDLDSRAHVRVARKHPPPAGADLARRGTRSRAGATGRSRRRARRGCAVVDSGRASRRH